MIQIIHLRAAKRCILKLITKSFSSSFDSNIRFRRATFEDIPFIDDCNLKTLPEHYDRDFYADQLQRFPELSIVAENEKLDLLGYALGTIKPHVDRVELRVQGIIAPDSGHCASIAVHSQYRGKGVARCLMRHLHVNLALFRDIDRISLYCRHSNTSAYNLYLNSLKYRLNRAVQAYYRDGEDAHYMTKENLIQDLSQNIQLLKNECNTNNFEPQQRLPTKSKPQNNTSYFNFPSLLPNTTEVENEVKSGGVLRNVNKQYLRTFDRNTTSDTKNEVNKEVLSNFEQYMKSFDSNTKNEVSSVSSAKQGSSSDIWKGLREYQKNKFGNY